MLLSILFVERRINANRDGVITPQTSNRVAVSVHPTCSHSHARWPPCAIDYTCVNQSGRFFEMVLYPFALDERFEANPAIAMPLDPFADF